MSETPADNDSNSTTAEYPTPCSVAGCERPAKGRGWCGMHFMRWWRHGDTAATLPAGPAGTPLLNPTRAEAAREGMAAHARLKRVVDEMDRAEQEAKPQA